MKTIEIPDGLTEAQTADVIAFAESIAEMAKAHNGVESWGYFAIKEESDGIRVTSGGCMIEPLYDSIQGTVQQVYIVQNAIATGHVLIVGDDGEEVRPESLN